MSKNIVNFLLENSSSPEEYQQSIHNYAKSVLGEDEVSAIKQSSHDPVNYANNLRDKLSQEKEIPENNEYIQGLYKGIENLGYGPAKIAAHIATPLLEAARAPFKYVAENVGENTSQTPPIDTTAEFTQSDWYGLPSNRATTSNILTDISNAMGIKQEPLAKIDIEGYPKASEALTQFTNPAVAGGAVADTVLASGKVPFTNIETPSFKFGKYNRVAENPISSIPAETMSGLTKRPLMSLETAANYIRSLAKDRSQLLELEKSGRIYELANIVRNDPEKYLHQFRPNKVYENITGKIRPALADRNYNTGELSRLSNLQDSAIESIPRDTYNIKSHDLKAEAIDNLNNMGLLETQKEAAINFINKEIPVYYPDQAKLERIRKIGNLSSEYKNIRDNQPDLILEDLTPETKQRSEYVSSSELASGQPSEPRKIPNQEKITKLAELEQQMKDLGANDPHGSSVEAYSQLVDEKNVMGVSDLSDIRKKGNKLMTPASVGEDRFSIESRNLAGRAMEKAAHNQQDIAMGLSDMSWQDIARYNDRNKSISNNLLLRDLFEGNLVADNYGGTEYLPSSMTGKTGGIGFIAKAKDRFIKPTIGPMANQAYNLGVDMAQGMGKYAGVNMMLGNNLLNDYKLPRSHEEFIAELPMVQKKLSSVMGEDAANQAISQLQSSPQEFYDKLPLIENQLPGLFKYDRYRRVNGRIFDPTLKALAEKEILNSPMSNSEKMMKQSMLLKNGLYDGI